MQTFGLVKVLRLCRRCGEWTTIGNFSHTPRLGRRGPTNGSVCHRCWKKGTPKFDRNWWVVTDLGRAALREMEATAA